MFKDFLETSSWNVQVILIEKASVNVAALVDNKDKLILHSLLYNKKKSAKSALNVANFYNFRLGKMGDIKHLKTKEWKRSRRKIAHLTELFKKELETLILEYIKSH